MKIIRSPRFDRAYKKLPKEVKKIFGEKIKLLIYSNFSHPSLRVKKIKGTGYIGEASVDMNHSFTFEKIDDGVKLRVIGKHDILDRP